MKQRKFPDRIDIFILVVLLAVAVVAGFWDRIGPDFLPLDRSYVGPNLVAAAVQSVVVFLVAVVFWPPFRARVDAFVTRHLKPIHDHFHKTHAHNEWAAKQLTELHWEVTGRPPTKHPHGWGEGG